MPRGETGKQRATRIPLDYYKKPDAIMRWKLGLSALALVLVLGWWASGLALGGRGGLGSNGWGRLRMSHGPVAKVHATWEAQCDACHVPYAPISEPARQWTQTVGFGGQASDAKCQSCHAGPAHHDNMRAVDVVSCAGCHRDHQGRDFSLVSLDDKDCTSCHGDLSAHADLAKTTGGKVSYQDVTAFARGDQGHPEFRVLRDKAPDPGRLKFNHALHMAAGLTTVKDGKPIFTLAQLAEADRGRYRRPGQKDGDAVRLDCASCHVLDGGDVSAAKFAGLPSNLLPSRGEGAYYLPIVYENQCVACHKLEVAGRAGPVAVRHRLQPDELRGELEMRILGQLLAEDPKTWDRFGPSRRVPGASAEEEEKVRKAVQDDAGRAMTALFGGAKNTCTECHYFETPAKKTLAQPDGQAELTALRIAPPRVPTVWLEHAAFTHAPHRAVDCRSCHARAYPDAQEASGLPARPGGTTLANGKGTWASHEDVLLPSIQTCRQCHAPASHSGGVSLGGAGHNCTECHTYHNGPPAAGRGRGLGAVARDARAAMDIRQFLLGAPEQPTPKKP